MTREEFLKLRPMAGTDCDRDYGFIDYRDKVVVDVGADYGTTASFFLNRGAVMVVAVEGDEELFSQLQENVKDVPEVVAVKCWISSVKDFTDLIETYRPDVLKVDCEGCEVHLLDVEDNIFRKVSTYLLEVHTKALWESFRGKFQTLGYTITYVDHWTTNLFPFITGFDEVRVVHAVSTQLLFNERRKEMGLS